MKAFYYAARGIVSTVKSEKNMRIHLAFTFYVVLCGIITGISAYEWGNVLICIALVTGAECINTAIENLCDEVHPQKARGIELAKDAAAGAVLICAVVSAVNGGIVFFRASRILAFFEFCREYKLLAAAFFVTVPLWLYFIIIAWRRNDDK